VTKARKQRQRLPEFLREDLLPGNPACPDWESLISNVRL
jgi:hypothetical protein